VTIQFGGHVFVVDPVASGRRGGTPWRECHPVPKGENNLYQCIKYRHGRFFRKHGEDSVQVFDSAARKWSTLCRTKGRFSQFEVLRGGDIVLLCSGLPDPGAPARTGMDMTIQRYLKGSFRFLEICPQGSDRQGPRSGPGLPDDLESLCRQVDDIPVFDRMVPFDDKLLVIHSLLGLLYLYDPAKSSLARIDAPWPSLTPAFLEQARTRQALPTAQLVLSQGLFPSEIQVYPRDALTATVLVRMNNHIRVDAAQARDREERARGRGFILPSRDFIDQDIRDGEDWSVYDLDLVSRTLLPSAVPKPLDVLLTRFPDEFWMDPQGGMHDLKAWVSRRNVGPQVGPARSCPRVEPYSARRQ